MHPAKNFAAKQVLCLLLGTALGACTPLGIDSSEEALYGIRTVSFDKNGGDTEAVPASMTLRPPVNTLGRLPEQPTRARHTFMEWNTEKDGSGSPFAEQTPVTANILLILYAQWEAHLELQLPTGLATLTPMAGERSATFSVTVSGFHSEEDAQGVTLSRDLVDAQGLSLRKLVSSYTPRSHIVHLTVEYDGLTPFPEGFATLHFDLENIPKGYRYGGGPQTLRVYIADGLEKTRPIPVNADNIHTFNDYANTPEGLGQHYQLMENVALTPPEAGQSNWTAIGTYGYIPADNRPFTGSFDGGGHSIVGLTLHATDDIDQSDFQGMFGQIEGAEIKNLGLEGGSVTGRGYVGGLVGMSRDGTVHNSYATGSVQGSNYVGGLVGYNWGGPVHNSYATGSVTGADGVGGLVGQNRNGAVHNSYATGNVKGSFFVGGLVGDNFSRVENSYATGSVQGSNYVGGLVGDNWGSAARVQGSVALNPSVVATANAGRVVGRNHPDAALTDNRARSNMALTPPAELDTIGANLKNGAGVSAAAYGSESFWKAEPMHWDFDTVWEWGPIGLPILQGLGGEQRLIP